jgi:hypothetical protein
MFIATLSTDKISLTKFNKLLLLYVVRWKLMLLKTGRQFKNMQSTVLAWIEGNSEAKINSTQNITAQKIWFTIVISFSYYKQMWSTNYSSLFTASAVLHAVLWWHDSEWEHNNNMHQACHTQCLQAT